jgi:hypothetical protein
MKVLVNCLQRSVTYRMNEWRNELWSGKLKSPDSVDQPWGGKDDKEGCAILDSFTGPNGTEDGSRGIYQTSLARVYL